MDKKLPVPTEEHPQCSIRGPSYAVSGEVKPIAPILDFAKFEKAYEEELLEKSKLLNSERHEKILGPSMRCPRNRLFVEAPKEPNEENTSMMSMNFSHYELLRNISHSNCKSEGNFSPSTCSTLSLGEREAPASPDDHMERYFQSVDLWYGNDSPLGKK